MTSLSLPTGATNGKKSQGITEDISSKQAP